ncbi:DinB family protein [Lacunimicrobium album]
MRIADVFLPEFEREVARTRKVLGVIPADKMEWKLAPGFNTIGWNANHLVNIVEWMPAICASPEFDLAPPGETPVPPTVWRTAEELVGKLDEYAEAGRRALAGTSDEAMAEDWSLKMGGQVLFTVSKGECLETWVMNHLVHHRAILTIYLRHSGVEGVPEYGG